MMPEQAALLQKSKSSVAAARLLADQDFYEFSVGRAYYAMFYIAEAFLLNQELQFSKHAAVIAAFGQHYAKTGKVPPQFHRYLIQGQDSRLIGDYDPSVIITRSHALEQIKHAEAFIELAENML